MARIKKAQRGYTSPSADSTSIYTKRMLSNMNMADRSRGELKNIFTKEWQRNAADIERQSKKGKPGYDKDGFPIKNKKMKTGGKLKKGQAGLVAPNKRVGPIDPRGAFTKVQKQTLAGKRTPVSLTPDKELGATKMSRKGSTVEKAKGGKWIQKAIKKPGALLESLGVKKGEKIPAGKLAAAAKKPGKMGQRARLAKTLGKLRKKK